jgi:beta-phosphoglucomutase
MIKAIIFDMDGVLVDSEPIHIAIEKHQFSLNNLSISDEEHKQYMGVSSEIMWQTIAELHTLSLSVNEHIEQHRKESHRHFSELDEIPVMPGLVDLLENLKTKGYTLAVASSSTPEIIDLILNKTHLKKYFQVLVSTQQAGKSKPEPDVFLMAAQKLGVSRAHCLVIEDSDNGLKAAIAAHMMCVAYQGPDADPKNQTEANYVVKSFAQLELILKLLH